MRFEIIPAICFFGGLFSDSGLGFLRISFRIIFHFLISIVSFPEEAVSQQAFSIYCGGRIIDISMNAPRTVAFFIKNCVGRSFGYKVA